MKRISLVVAVLAILQGSAAAQVTITDVIPAASSPGYLVTIEGTNLQFTVCMRFRAFVGGFVGVREVESPALTVTNTRVTALVPQINSFIPPGEAQAGDPLGEVALVDLFGFESDASAFYYFEGTGGFLENVGAATTQPNGEQAAISFHLPNFPPTPGNPVFTPLLQNAEAGAAAALFFGLPASTPLPIFGGEFAIDPVILAAPTIVGPGGQTARTFPIPPLSVLQGLSFVMQWGFIDSVPSIQLSNGLQMNY